MAISISLENCDLEEVIVIGGGIAGLTCLNALLDAGIAASLYEGGMVGSPKMCGEFIAPQAVALLQDWGLSAIYPIQSAEFFVGDKKLISKLQYHAGAISRSVAEHFLAARARTLGGRVHENKRITNIHPPKSMTEPFLMQLENGENLQCKTAFFATGKMNIKSFNTATYSGIKMHLPRPPSLNCLQMFSIRHAYMGLVPISEDTCNFACLIKQDIAATNFDRIQFLTTVAEEYPEFATAIAHLDLKNHYCLQVRAPEFGLRQLPKWHNAYWIGDAMASLHPSVGSGFSHAMLSAICSVQDYVLKTQKTASYRSALKRKLKVSYCLHQLLLHPMLGHYAISIAKYNRINTTLQSLLFAPI